MSDLIDTTEMYLRTIYELREDGVIPLRARIAEHLGHAGPTVSQTVARMERDGLVEVSQDRHLELTPHGEELAMRVMRKHRLAERLLTDVIGMELAFVHEEACRWEHVMSERVERRVLELVPDARVSPYGNEIPGLDELGVTMPALPHTHEMSIADLGDDHGDSHTLTRIGETPQTSPEFLAELSDIRLLPGAAVTVTPLDGGVRLSTEHGSMAVDTDVARHLFVALP